MCEELYKARPKRDPEDPLGLPYESAQRKLIVPPFAVQVDGPCGAPAQRHSDFKVLLLVVSISPRPFCYLSLSTASHRSSRSLSCSRLAPSWVPQNESLTQISVRLLVSQP